MIRLHSLAKMGHFIAGRLVRLSPEIAAEPSEHWPKRKTGKMERLYQSSRGGTMERHFVRLFAAVALTASAWTARPVAAQQPQNAEPQFDQRSERQPQNAEQLPDARPQSVEVPTSAMNSQPALAPYPNRPQYLFLSPSYHGTGRVVPAQAYSYGWFGACSPPHAVFHWDYFNTRWIWW